MKKEVGRETLSREMLNVVPKNRNEKTMNNLWCHDDVKPKAFSKGRYS